MKAPLGILVFLFSTHAFGGLELGALLSYQVFCVDRLGGDLDFQVA